jgi:hypothetical protein
LVASSLRILRRNDQACLLATVNYSQRE